MHNGFTSYILSYDGSGTPALVKHTQALHPNEPFTLDADCGQIFLASGFSSLFADTALPLSSTLQLNGDLGNFSREQLVKIARAELDRSTGVHYRSLVSEADPKVVVLAHSAADLDRFMESYGGVLEITGLLTQGTHPELTTVTELDVRTKKNGVRLDFFVRTPVNHSLCTYCGNCGPVCPEKCIDEHLFLDLGRCTFCNTCLQVCPTGAIDLYGAEKRSIETPALLLLAETEVELPKDTGFIFREEHLSRLFASIFSCQIDETVTCNNQLCQYSGRLDLGCDLCSRACSHNAILRDNAGIEVDQQNCRECGGCVALCPTGAIQFLRFTDQNFISYFRELPLEPGCSIVIGPEHLLHAFWWQNRNLKFPRTFFLEYPVPASLTSMHLLFLLSLGVGKIFLLGEGSQEQAPSRQTAQVNTIGAELFSWSAPVQSVEAETLAPLLQQEYKSPLTSFCKDFSFTSRREKLVSLLAFFLEQTGQSHQFTGERFSDFGRINCDQDRCTQCLACVGECHVHALAADGEHFALMHTPALCVQCGLCSTICPESALSMQTGLFLDGDFFKEDVLARAEPLKCLECGKVFGTRKSLTKVMAVLTEKNMLDKGDNLLSYCETCRVVHLFEAQGT